MKELKFKYHDSGIISCICNTEHRWIDYDTCVEFAEIPSPDMKRNLVFYERDTDNYTREKIAQAEIQFDVNKYHRLEEAEKDQIVIYFIPKEMLL